VRLVLGRRDMNRFPRPSKARRRRRARNRGRQAWIVITFGCTLSLGALATDEYMLLQQQRAAARSALSDDEIYTGSILYLPNRGNLCRQLLFDNHNGRVTDNGYVDCDRAAYQGSLDTPKQWSTARLRVISDGFLQH
jgi:hypothetical protein